jgi:hypothetical protein
MSKIYKIKPSSLSKYGIECSHCLWMGMNGLSLRGIQGTRACGERRERIGYGVKFGSHFFITVLVVTIAIWIAYKLFRALAKQAIMTAYIFICFVFLLMGTAVYIYLKYINQ